MCNNLKKSSPWVGCPGRAFKIFLYICYSFTAQRGVMQTDISIQQQQIIFNLLAIAVPF